MLTIDFETYYDSEYSLSKMTTEEYIRDPRFEVIGVSVKRDTDKARWFTGTFKDTQKWLAQFDWDEEVVLAHNAAFDMAILNWHFDIRPKRIADTLSMARALDGPDAGNSLAKLAERHGAGVKGDEVIHALGKRRLDFSPSEIERYGQYCVNDVELTYKLFEKMAEGFPLVEFRLIDLTIRMFTEPELALNTAALDAHLNTVKAKKDELMAAVAADKSQLMSNPKLANLLESMGVEPPKKISPTTGKETWAFGKNDEKFKALLEHTNPAVQAVVAARMGVKSTLEETRTERFIGISKRGKLPIPLRYYAAHTGRWGGCLVADTAVIVYNTAHGVQTKRIVDVLLDDLVWDGEEFVPHEGVVFSGYSEVLEWDGVKGTEDHVVFTDAGEISLREAMQRSERIQAARSPTQDDVDAARRLAFIYEE
jgi:DNA polymerase III epsilon subunit-like protein